MLHHADSLGELDAVERSREAPERLPVAVLDDEPALVGPPLGVGRELESRAVRETDRFEAIELDPARLARLVLALDPDCPLAAGLGVVDPRDQVPGDLAAVGRGPDSGRPVPDGVPGVVAGRLVLDRAQRLVDLAALAEVEVEIDPRRPLAGPDVAAVPVRADRLGPGAALAERELRGDPAGVDLRPQAVPGRPELPGTLAAAALAPDLAPLCRQELLGVLDDLAALAVEDRPERLPERADPDAGGAEHHPLAEGADVAPPLSPGSP